MRAASPRSRPQCTRSGRSSPGRWASKTTSRSTCTRCRCCPATGSCSAPTVSPRCCVPGPSAALLRRESDPTRAANLLVDAANGAGGEDNITTIVIDIEDDGADPFAPATPSVGPEVTVAMPVALGTAADVPSGAVPSEAAPPSAPPPPAGASPAPAPSPVPDEATAAQALARRERAERRKDRSPAKSAGRFARFLLPIVLILGLAFAVTAWYALPLVLRRVRPLRPGHDLPGSTRRAVALGPDGRPAHQGDQTRAHRGRAGRRSRPARSSTTRTPALAFVGRVEDHAAAATSTTTTTTTTTPLVPVPST